MLKKIVFFVVFITCGITIKAGVETVSLDFELSETAINRALVSQFNDPNFVFHHFIGEFEFSPGLTVPYDVQLERPTVEIGDDWIGIHLVFHVNLPSLGFEYELDVTPSITVEEQNITAGEVVAEIENLEETIDSWTNIPESVRDLLKILYNIYEPQVYASDLFNDVLEELNSDEFFQQRALSITDFGLSNAFAEGKFVLKVLITISYSETEFAIFIDTSVGNDKILFRSNISSIVNAVILWSMEIGEEVYNKENLNIPLVWNEDLNKYYAELSLGNIISEGRFILKILFNTDTTFYLNYYGVISDYWRFPTDVINY